MQLRFTVPFWLTGSNFKPSLSAVLSGTTAIGAISVAIYNSNIAWNSIGNSLKSLKDTPVAKHLLKGIEKVGNTFQNWGSAIVSSKDAFSDWFKRYFDANGLKAGVFALYEKLKVWVLIVYEWFATKFIEFLGNIPEMVKNWNRLRLSLFKWGTFLGGGGGSALFSMLGSGDNWGKLAELMGNPNFAEMMKDFEQLMQDNEEAFKEMGPEEIEDILQKYLDEPEEAQKAAKELLEEQKERKKKAKEEKPDQDEKQRELSAEEIKEKFNPSPGGNPPDVPSVLSSMVNFGLKGLGGFSYSSSFDSPLSETQKKVKEKAKEGMMSFLNSVETYVKKEKTKPKKEPSVKAKFWDIVSKNKELFVEELSKAAMEAYLTADSLKIEALTQKFIEKITVPCKGGKDCNADGLVKALSKK